MRRDGQRQGGRDRYTRCAAAKSVAKAESPREKDYKYDRKMVITMHIEAVYIST